MHSTTILLTNDGFKILHHENIAVLCDRIRFSTFGIDETLYIQMYISYENQYVYIGSLKVEHYDKLNIKFGYETEED